MCYRLTILSCLACWYMSMSAQDAILNAGDLQIHPSAHISFHGDVINQGSWDGTGTMHLNGSAQQLIAGNTPIRTADLNLNNGAGVTLETILNVNGNMNFVAGILSSNRAFSTDEFIRFNSGATASGFNDNSHIDGFCRKVGNTPFLFPVGASGQIQPIAISGTSSISQEFEVTYLQVDPVTVSNTASRDASIQHISDCEYWILNPMNGNPAINVTLAHDFNSCGVGNQASLVVGHWDGTSWRNRGNMATTGNIGAGTVTSNSFMAEGVLSLGSTDGLNVLPIQLLYFTADVIDEEVWLFWRTESELNNAYFEVERSLDTEHWQVVGSLPGAGNSSVGIDYSLPDVEPFAGMSFYRLKQVDYDGRFSYSQIETLFFAPVLSSSVYPNPSHGTLNIQLNAQATVPNIKLYNAIGQVISAPVESLDGALYQLNTNNLSAGVYIIHVTTPNGVESHEFIIE